MKVSKSYNDLIDFDNIAKVYVERMDNQENKLTYAITKMMVRLKRLHEKINEKITKINLKHCLVDESKKEKPILKDQHKEICFSKESRDACNDEITEKILGENVYEIEPYYCTEIPENLKQFEIEAFRGIVLDPEKFPE